MSETCRKVKYFPLYDFEPKVFDKIENIEIINDKPIGFIGENKAEK